MLNPAFALVSMNITPKSRALLSPSSIDTCLSNGNVKLIAEWQKLPCKLIRSRSSVLVPLVNEICLVTHENNDDIATSLCTNILNPLGGVQEWLPICTLKKISRRLYIHSCKIFWGTGSFLCVRLWFFNKGCIYRRTSNKFKGKAERFFTEGLTCNIIDNNSNRRISDITRYQTSKPLLSSSIPVPLQSHKRTTYQTTQTICIHQNIFI